MSESNKEELFRRVMWAVKTLGQDRLPKNVTDVPNFRLSFERQLRVLRLQFDTAKVTVFWVEALQNLRIRATVFTPGQYPESLLIYDYFPKYFVDIWHGGALNRELCTQLLERLRSMMLLEDIAGV